MRHRPELASHSFTVLSSDAVARNRESADHATSETPPSCPVRLLSNFDVRADHSRTLLSAAEEVRGCEAEKGEWGQRGHAARSAHTDAQLLAIDSPSGENFTALIERECPRRVAFRS